MDQLFAPPAATLPSAFRSGSGSGVSWKRTARPSADWWLVEGSLTQKLRSFAGGPVPYRVAVDLRGVPQYFFDFVIEADPGCETAEDWCCRELPAISEWLVQSSVSPLPNGRKVPTQVHPWELEEPPPQADTLISLGQCAMLPGAVFYLIAGERFSSH